MQFPAHTFWAVNKLAARVEVPIPVFSFHSVRELTGFHLEMNLDVVNFIIESKENICNNKELSSLVKEYLKKSIQTLEFCGALENCLKRAQKNLQIIQLAVQKFEEEVLDGGEERKFRKTLDELNKFKAAEEPFDEEFIEQFLSVRRQQVLLLNKLLQQKRVVDKNLKLVKIWRKVFNYFFFIVSVFVVIFSVVAAAKASTVVSSVAGALVVPVGSLGNWCSRRISRREKKLEWQELLISMKGVTGYITIEDMETIRTLVQKMVTKIVPVLDAANLALSKPEAVKVVVDDIKKREEELMETIEDLGKRADNCSQAITKARSLILQKIIEPPSQSAVADSFWNLLY